MASISLQQLAQYAVTQIESGASQGDVAQKLAAYLVDERQSRQMPQLIRMVERELTSRGYEYVAVTSAHPVDADMKQKLASLLDVSKPIFSEEIDERVIGGVAARSGDTEVDLTVRGKLRRFKQHVMNS